MISFDVVCVILHMFKQFDSNTAKMLDFLLGVPKATAPKIDLSVGGPAQHDVSKEAFSNE